VHLPSQQTSSLQKFSSKNGHQVSSYSEETVIATRCQDVQAEPGSKCNSIVVLNMSYQNPRNKDHCHHLYKPPGFHSHNLGGWKTQVHKLVHMLDREKMLGKDPSYVLGKESRNLLG
jgi:hypothetical protein